MSPGQQANDTHLTVWWHPNPLRHLTRGITNLPAIIQFASCKLPFHSTKKWFPICNVCVKRITNVILIFMQTIRHHKREHCVHKITPGLCGRMMIRREEGEEKPHGVDWDWRCKRYRSVFKDNERSWYLSHCWAESISQSFTKCSSFILCQEFVPFLKKKSVEYISRHNFSANQKLKCLKNSLTVLPPSITGPTPSFSTSAAVYLIQYGFVSPWRQISVLQCAEVCFPHLGLDILQACDSVEALRLISQTSYPPMAFSPVSSPPSLSDSHVTKLM